MKWILIKLWDAVKVVLRVKFMALNTYVRKEENFKIINLRFHLRTLEREEQIKAKISITTEKALEHK